MTLSAAVLQRPLPIKLIALKICRFHCKGTCSNSRAAHRVLGSLVTPGGLVGRRLYRSSAAMWFDSVSSTTLKEMQGEGVGHGSNDKASASKHGLSISWEKTQELQKKGMPTWHLKSVFDELSKYHSRKSDSLGKKVQIRGPVTEYHKIKRIGGNGEAWRGQLYLFYPEEKMFEIVGIAKKAIENELALKAINFLRQKDVVDADLKPNFESRESLAEAKEQLSAAIVIPAIPMKHKAEMGRFMGTFESRIVHAIEGSTRSTSKASSLFDIGGDRGEPFSRPGSSAALDQMEVESEEEYSETMYNPVSGRQYREPNERDTFRRNRTLGEHINSLRPERERRDTSFRESRTKVSRLPICAYRDKIISTIEQNQVTVISGETGCGKTTQVPQYILEHFIKMDRGANCSMVVTQPRRLPAISIADQTAYQFGEEGVGKTIGYQVRMDKMVPACDQGVIFFCTAGILLRKLENNPDLLGVSHVIVDEVHERDVIIDLLLILLRRTIRRNKNLKVVLMSASINARQFSDYFGDAPCLSVPGRCYPVTNHYLDDIPQSSYRKSSGHKSSSRSFMPKVDYEQIADLIVHIDRNFNKPHEEGAVLCFLPGWEEIKRVSEELELRLHKTANKLMVIPVHSRLPHSEQKLIFQTPPLGVRKVVLSTNIAETSLTVPDIVHVIDPGLCKEVRYDKRSDMTTFGTHWISKANAKQRAGRAGRVQSGHCWRLYTQDDESNFMADYPTPEMLRVPLETVVMQAKLYCPDEKANEFLAEALSPPERSPLKFALETLRACNVLADNETLTILGRRIVPFSIHPRLSVALVAATMLGVLDSALNIAAVLSAPRPPFFGILDDKKAIQVVKERFTDGSRSDHVALANVMTGYENAQSTYDERLFVEENRIHVTAAKQILDLKKLFAQELVSSGMVDYLDLKNKSAVCNRFEKTPVLLIASLLTGLYPNLVLKPKGEVRGSKIVQATLKDTRTDYPVRLTSDSVAKESLRRQGQNYQNIMTYFGAFYSEHSKQLTLKEASAVSPYTFLIFAGKKIDRIMDRSGGSSEAGWGPQIDHGSRNVQNQRGQDGKVTLQMDDCEYLRFTAYEDDLDLLLRWKNALYSYSIWFITRDSSESRSAVDKEIEQSLEQYLQITKRLLENENTIDKMC